MAPEVIQASVYDTKADIWSEGITAIEMAEIVPPYANVHPMRALFMIPRDPPPTLKNKKMWSQNFQDFLSKCLTKDPQARFDAADLLKVRRCWLFVEISSTNLLRKQDLSVC